MKKLALILAVLFLFSTPALATSVDDLISELESELTAVPDLSSAFGSVGEAQGEVFATGVITGEGTLYEDDGIGSAGADLLLLQQGFSASAVLVAQRAGTLYVRGAASVLILPQIIPGQTLVIIGGESAAASPTPTPAPVVYNAVSLNIGGVTSTLEQSTGTSTSISLDASFSGEAAQFVIGLPLSLTTGNAITPQSAANATDSYPYLSYIDESGTEWYALAWSRPTGVAPDLSIEYVIEREPSEAADFTITIELAQDGEYRGHFQATLVNTKDTSQTLALSGAFHFNAPMS